jgi:hypothetical protein
MIGPSFSSEIDFVEWTPEDVQFLKFLELWAAFSPILLHSTMQSIGSALLRLMGIYSAVEDYDRGLAWSFLQEVGWIRPWELHATFHSRLPGCEVRRTDGAFHTFRPPVANIRRSLRPDVAAGHRKHWGGATAYCIDDESAGELDDAVSLERTETDGEYWVHVHVADPAAILQPDSEVARYAQLVPENVYVGGNMVAMFPPDFAEMAATDLSLHTGSRCLTFSTKVNEAGDVLERRVEPGIMGNVVHLTYDGTDESLLGKLPGSRERTSMAVGQPPPKSTRSRWPTTPTSQLPETGKEDLLILSRLAKTLRGVWAQQGGAQSFSSNPEIRVSMNHVEKAPSAARGDQAQAVWLGDPYIEITHGGPKSYSMLTISSLMQLAGHTAAEWCRDRGLPIPYWVHRHTAANAELIRKKMREAFPMGLEYEEVTEQPPAGLWLEIMSLRGPAVLTTTPGPFFTTHDVYTKATSPLRRYSDLLLHWQIHAALAEERRVGSSPLSSEVTNAWGVLPFSRDAMDHTLEDVAHRTMILRGMERRSSVRQWMAQAVTRASQFGEAELPKTFRYEVAANDNGTITGKLVDFFNAFAHLHGQTLKGITLVRNVKAYDQFEVEIQKIDTRKGIIMTNALRRWEDREKEGKERENAAEESRVETLENAIV